VEDIHAKQVINILDIRIVHIRPMGNLTTTSKHIPDKRIKTTYIKNI